MAARQITVWGAVSLRAHRVHWALHELGLNYQTRPILSRSGETQTDAYTTLNPKQKIPYLQDGAFGLSESAAIVQYLFREYGEGSGLHVPRSAQDQARVDEWCYFAMTELDAHSLYLIRRHEGLAEIYGAAPEAVASARDYFTKQRLAVAPQVGAANPFLFGPRLSAADILLTSCLDWADRYGIALADEIVPYRERTTSRPAYLAAWQACGE